MAWDVMSGYQKQHGMLCPGDKNKNSYKNSMGRFVRGGKSLWDVLSRCQKMAWDVLSWDVLSGFQHDKYRLTADVDWSNSGHFIRHKWEIRDVLYPNKKFYDLLFYVPVSSYEHIGTVSSPNKA